MDRHRETSTPTSSHVQNWTCTESRGTKKHVDEHVREQCWIIGSGSESGSTCNMCFTCRDRVGKNIGQQYCWCSLMWLMPLRSLSNCDYELIFYLRLRLGPIHSNQVMGTDPVGSHHGTRNSQSNSINPTYPY